MHYSLDRGEIGKRPKKGQQDEVEQFCQYRNSRFITIPNEKTKVSQERSGKHGQKCNLVKNHLVKLI